ncbi:NADH-quinone oxidoreductase subunit C [Dehalogenimonas sp. THU2]|jgi:NADH-quinone oxidoreductase subunit C|uniref:NADH-quinone oxidoreductase subunit C n=1 Tax=Dehalogenimonas sp. THU2 TaxID=3151121 RepID=UPI003218BE41
MLDLDCIAVHERLKDKFGEGASAADNGRLSVKPDRLTEVAAFLRDDPEFNFDYLNSVTGVDHKTHFSLIYRLTSLSRKQRLDFRVDLTDHDKPTAPSVTPVWRGADLQEREIYDLMGIEFTGHPNLKRILLWDGFPGYPLRKDWVDRDA